MQASIAACKHAAPAVYTADAMRRGLRHRPSPRRPAAARRPSPARHACWWRRPHRMPAGGGARTASCWGRRPHAMPAGGGARTACLLVAAVLLVVAAAAASLLLLVATPPCSARARHLSSPTPQPDPDTSAPRHLSSIPTPHQRRQRRPSRGRRRHASRRHRRRPAGLWRLPTTSSSSRQLLAVLAASGSFRRVPNVIMTARPAPVTPRHRCRLRSPSRSRSPIRSQLRLLCHQSKKHPAPSRRC